MAALDPSNTARLYVDYEVAGQNHTLQCRLGTGVLTTDGMDVVADFLDALSSALYLVTVLGARFSASGSNVSNPVPWSGDPTYGADVGPPNASANYLDFVGRSNDGRRVRVAVFGARFVAASAGDFRATGGEVAAIGDALAVLLDTEGQFVTVSGLQPSWKQYANTGNNAYWRNHIR